MDLKDAKQIHYELFNASDWLAANVMHRRIQEYQLPFLGELDNRDKLIKKDWGIIDGVAWRADQVFAGGMASGSVPQTVEWFDLWCEEMEQDQNLRQLVQLQQRIINQALNMSNFYTSMYSAYLELPFGQSPRGCFFIPHVGLVFENYSVGSYAYALDPYQDVTHFTVKKEMPLSKIIAKFGLENLPESLQARSKEKRGLTELHKLYWLVTKNEDYDGKKLGAKNKPYTSIYWLDCGDKPVHEGGFDTCPITVMRYLAIPNSDYGVGCGWFADSDVRVMYDMLAAAMGNMELFYNMPLQVPAGTEVDYRPGAITEITSQGKVESLFNTAPVFDKVFEKAQEREDRINAAYNTNLFAMLSQQQADNPYRTAYEWSLRQQEKMQQLTPVITRINTEVLGKDIKRVYQIFQEHGGFPVMPPEYDGLDLHIEYVSPLAKVQRMSSVQDYEGAIAAIGQTMQIKPQVADYLKEGEFIRQWLNSLGVRADILYTDEEHAEIQEAQAEAMQEQQQMQMEQQGIEQLPAITKAAENLQEMVNKSGTPLQTLRQELNRV